MKPFAFSSTSSADDAIRDAAGDPRARFVAGGTTLIDLMKLDVETPDRVVDINGIADPQLRTISALPDGSLRVGALVRNSDMAWHPLVRERYPVLSQALLAGASGQLRNMATTGGNLLQRTRCWYFRDTAMPCNKREPGSGCSAIRGQNRIHAVLGGSEHCIATHPSDMAVALAALDARVRTRGPEGERTIDVVDLHLLPADHPERENVLRPGELITAVDIPPLPFGRRSHYLKVRDRASFAFALASAAVALDLQGGAIHDARVALGGVGTKPWRSREAERRLIGKPATPATFTAAARSALAGARTYRDNAFKVQLARRTLVRALTTAAALG